MKNICYLLLICLVLSGCATRTKFSGAAKVEQGPVGCEQKCRAWNMELVGMVALGEYSDACICSKKGASLSLHSVGQVLAASAASGGVIGQIMQAQDADSAPSLQIRVDSGAPDHTRSMASLLR